MTASRALERLILYQFQHKIDNLSKLASYGVTLGANPEANPLAKVPSIEQWINYTLLSTLRLPYRRKWINFSAQSTGNRICVNQ